MYSVAVRKCETGGRSVAVAVVHVKLLGSVESNYIDLNFDSYKQRIALILAEGMPDNIEIFAIYEDVFERIEHVLAVV